MIPARHRELRSHSMVSRLRFPDQHVDQTLTGSIVDVRSDDSDVFAALFFENAIEHVSFLVEPFDVLDEIGLGHAPDGCVQHARRFGVHHPSRPALRRIIYRERPNEVIAAIDNSFELLRTSRRLHACPPRSSPARIELKSCFPRASRSRGTAAVESRQRHPRNKEAPGACYSTGVHSTCSMRAAPVKSITSRSKPSAMPQACGICASAARKSSSTG